MRGLTFELSWRRRQDVRPTLTGLSASVETQQRAQRGTSAFAAFCQHFRLWRGMRSLCLTPQRSASGNAGLEASAPSCGQHGGVKLFNSAHAVRLSGTSARGEQWHPQLAK